MARLARRIEDIRSRYDVIVIGSGYGGSIAASRLARAGRAVCLLERGREIRPGAYPDTPAEAAAEVRIDHAGGRAGARDGLFDFRVDRGLNVLVGCGLGGTSLINANVSLRAEPRVFDDPAWPAALRADVGEGLEEGYRRAEEMLRPTPYPTDRPTPPKMRAHRAAAEALGLPFAPTPINVTFEDGLNPVGVPQRACVDCGDCVSGCNYRAKNTTLMNYLPDAVNHGAEIFTGAEVRHVERGEGGWRVHYQLVDAGREVFDAPTPFVTAEVVVLGAGALGSTEILLRSATQGLPVSDQLGRRFSGNGDLLGFSYNGPDVIEGVGHGTRDPATSDPVGPCITSVIDLREQPVLDDGLVIEEGSMPGAIGGLVSGLLAVGSSAGSVPPGGDPLARTRRQLRTLTGGPYVGAMRATQTYLVMGHDSGTGALRLEDDRLRIDWKGAGFERVASTADRRLEQIAHAIGGVYQRNPTWHRLLGDTLVTVHPLGGCNMGEDAERGVVDHAGRVFAGRRGAAVHDGLYVMDGAIVPRPLGVNPLLTISALAERAVARLADDRGWVIDRRLPGAPDADPAASAPIGVRFTETMKGHFAVGEQDHTRGRDVGRARGSSLQVFLTISTDDVDALVTDPAHLMKVIGSATAPALHPEPLSLSSGTFNLLVRGDGDARTRLMIYEAPLTTADGRVYFLYGQKDVRDDGGPDLWPDTSTLFVTLHDGASRESPVLGRGIIRISPADFARQLTTIRITDAPDRATRLRALTRFGGFFAGSLFAIYAPAGR